MPRNVISGNRPVLVHDRYRSGPCQAYQNMVCQHVLQHYLWGRKRRKKKKPEGTKEKKNDGRRKKRGGRGEGEEVLVQWCWTSDWLAAQVQLLSMSVSHEKSCWIVSSEIKAFIIL